MKKYIDYQTSRLKAKLRHGVGADSATVQIPTTLMMFVYRRIAACACSSSSAEGDHIVESVN
jgi:hypothetical protein